jgi:DNA-binding transcriptional ArsR family regulator
MDTLSMTLSALADPTRRGLLAQLALGEATVGELAEPYDMSLAAVSKHLKVLETAGLVSRSKTAQYRPCRLNAQPMKEALDYLSSYRRFWEDNFSRLDALLETMKTEESQRKDKK